MPRDFTNRRFLDALQHRVLVYDGAMGTSIQRYNLTADDFGGEQYNGCNDFLVITRPAVIEAIHASFLEVGVDVIETNTFRSNPITLREYGLAERTHEINVAAASLARRVADRFATPDHPRFVAGSIGPTGMLISADDPVLSQITYDELVTVFAAQARGLIEGGADVLLIETSQDILEVKAAVHGIQRAFEDLNARLPIQCQITLDVSGRMLLGTDIASALTTLERLGIDVFGMNCSTGPEHMREPIRYLGEISPLPISCIPNAGLPLNVDGEAVYPMEPEPFAEQLAEFVTRFGVSIVGGCCGTTPAHLKHLVDKVGQRPQTPRPAPTTPRLSSAIRATTLTQTPPPMLIGERVNSQGSRKIKRLLLNDDYDGIVQVALHQVESGAHTLDICVALTERADEKEQMHEVVKRLSMAVEAPLVIDSTDAAVVEEALKTAPGRVIVNSINMENGRERIDAVVPMVVQHGAAVMALTIDEIGMAKTAARKVEVAQKIYDIAVGEYGLAPDALIWDVLTFTLATGDAEWQESAVETIAGIRQVKAAFPGTLTSLGVSNVSFGLGEAARAVVNSVFLHRCVEAGLDMAIVNPAHIKPYAEISPEHRALADDLIFNRRPDALQNLIATFENVTLDDESAEDPTEGMSADERAYWRIVHRKKEGIEHDIDEIVGARLADRLGQPNPLANGPYAYPNPDTNAVAVDVLNTVLLPAMKEVGDKFGAGELILPFVLQSAEVMKKAVARTETYLERKDGATKGKVVLATVYGDVHDIGKNLVKTILVNNGYTVFDLGKQVPANVIIDKAVEEQADAIGLSALLVSTSKQMPLIVQELHQRGLNFPVMIGGAAINRKFGQRILFVDNEHQVPYGPGVFYCKDAFEGLDTIDALQNPDRRTPFVEANLTAARRSLSRPTDDAPSAPAVIRTSAVAEQRATIPAPPGGRYGVRTIHKMPLPVVLELLDKDELYRLSWGAKNAHGAEWDKLKAEFDARLGRMRREAEQTGWLQPQAVYGYWPAQRDGNDLIVYEPDNLTRELTRFSFPRQEAGEFLALSDYFAPRDSGVMDIVALQIVTVGQAATERFDLLQNADDYTEAYFVHGLAVQTAEAAAEYVHRHIRRELGLAEGQGKRYSWGYPAIPELDDHLKVFALLPAEQELGMTLSAAYQLIPEQSTAAIILHHPAAKYYSVGGSRLQQIERELARG